LLASQEAWAVSKLEHYPARPASLAFVADPVRRDDARRLAFLNALRLAPNSKFALYYQPDPQNNATGTALPFSAVSTLPAESNATQRFLALKPGDSVSALAVIASACDEPDYGLDINLWSDSPSDWGKRYGFGNLPFGNPSLAFSTQAPFHMAFLHESRVLYAAAPFLRRTYPLLRVHQFSTLSALAFRTGHSYWGWRFAGLSLHYLQDLTQPYHASLAPGESTLKLLWANALGMAGFSGPKNNLVVLLSNRHLALEKYQAELLYANALGHHETPLEKALRNNEADKAYPDWNDNYLREVVTAQSSSLGGPLVRTLLATFPAQYVDDPGFDFGVKESGINLLQELSSRDKAERQRLEQAITELMGNFGSHSRNAVRGILRSGSPQ
jgi:hypothetical protein